MKDDFDVAEAPLDQAVAPASFSAGEIFADPRVNRADPLARLRNLELALDSLGQALIVLRRDGKMDYISPHAARILAEEDGLLNTEEILRASLKEDDRELSETLATLFRHRKPGAASKLEVNIRRPSGKLAYKLRINVLCETGPVGAITAESAMVTIQDAHANYQAWYGRLQAHFQLTPRECECTMLLTEGYSMAEIANRMNISMQTLRQHLKHAFNKTGTHKQHELVGIVLQLLRKR